MMGGFSLRSGGSVVLLLAGCGGGSTGEAVDPHHPTPTCAAGTIPSEAGDCFPAGKQANGCAAGEVAATEGSCVPAGIAPDGCAAGFEPDPVDGCRAIFPSAPCGKGLFALPGETSCHEVSPCAPGQWGDAPIDAATSYVDGSYAGTSDG